LNNAQLKGGVASEMYATKDIIMFLLEGERMTQNQSNTTIKLKNRKIKDR